MGDDLYHIDTFIDLDTDGSNVVPHPAHERFRVGVDEISKRMRILYNILGSIVFKCVAQQDANFRRNCRDFRSLDMADLTTADVIPILRTFDYDHDV